MAGLTGPVLGIDLGTTFSVAATWDPIASRAVVIKDGLGRALVPSVVSFTEHEMLVGAAAVARMSSKAVDTVSCVKRLMGLPWDHTHVQREVKNSSCKIVAEAGSDGGMVPAVEVTYKKEVRRFRPEQISGFILSHILTLAQTQLGKAVEAVAVTVPAHFSVQQRDATRVAVSLAVPSTVFIGFLNEPTAAAVAHGYMEWANISRGTLMPAKVAGVVDFGGGTFDVTMLKVGFTLNDDGNRDAYVAAIASEGDPYLGGEDVDRILSGKVKDRIMREMKDFRMTARDEARVQAACTLAKKQLSMSIEAEVSVPTIRNEDGDEFSMTIVRNDMDAWCKADVYDRVVAVVKNAVGAAQSKYRGKSGDGLERGSNGDLVIHELILVGGSSRIPGFQDALRHAFPGITLSARLDADEAVASGAAAHACELSQGKDAGPASRLMLMDVTSARLGVEVQGGGFQMVIDKNEDLPVHATHTFFGASPTVERIRFSVYEGDAIWVKDARLLGEFVLPNVPKEPGAVAAVRVTFDMDVNGELNVFAQNAHESGPAQQHLTIRDTLRKVDERKMLEMAASSKDMAADVRDRAAWLAAKEQLLRSVDHIRRDSVQSASVSARMRADTRDRILKMLGDAQSYASEARMDKVSTTNLQRRMAALVTSFEAAISEVLTAPGLGTTGGGRVKQTALRSPQASPRAATGTPDTGCDDSDVAIVDAVVTGTTRTADGDHDRPSKRVRTSADKVFADTAARSGSARYKSDEEEEEEEGDMD